MLSRNLILLLASSLVLLITADSSTSTSVSTVSITSGSTVSGGSTASSSAPCQDNPDTDCSSFKSYCTNAKYIPMLKQFCPVTCNMCPGATTAVPPTPNPNCHDNSSNCPNWVKNGFCTNSFYTCADRLKYCAKSCDMCTKTCADLTNFNDGPEFNDI